MWSEGKGKFGRRGRGQKDKKRGKVPISSKKNPTKIRGGLGRGSGKGHIYKRGESG